MILSQEISQHHSKTYVSIERFTMLITMKVLLYAVPCKFKTECTEKHKHLAYSELIANCLLSYKI